MEAVGHVTYKFFATMFYRCKDDQLNAIAAEMRRNMNASGLPKVFVWLRPQYEGSWVLWVKEGGKPELGLIEGQVVTTEKPNGIE